MSLYGFCPRCGERGVRRERRMNGNDTCEAGHTYPTAESHSQPDKLIDRLTRENADLRARLAKMTKTLGDAGDEISNLSMLASNIEQRAERAEKARDEEAEAKRVLGRELFNRCFLGYDKAWRDAEIAKINNPTAAAAVKEAGQ